MSVGGVPFTACRRPWPHRLPPPLPPPPALPPFPPLRPQLGDFGLSRILGAEQTHLETANFGTASYAAPELLSGKLSSSSDIYSFGMIGE